VVVLSAWPRTNSISCNLYPPTSNSWLRLWYRPVISPLFGLSRRKHRYVQINAIWKWTMCSLKLTLRLETGCEYFSLSITENHSLAVRSAAKKDLGRACMKTGQKIRNRKDMNDGSRKRFSVLGDVFEWPCGPIETLGAIVSTRDIVRLLQL